MPTKPAKRRQAMSDEPTQEQQQPQESTTTEPTEPAKTEPAKKMLQVGVNTEDPQAFVTPHIPLNREFLGPNGEYLTADEYAKKKADQKAAAQQQQLSAGK